MSQGIFALVDCNSFFCSCERVFRPELNDRPVGVLSNNDGCFVARTNELKALGVKMGEPYFKVKDLCQKHNVAVFSSNFALYTNMSDRVMTILSQFAPRVEVYSVDEAFLDFTGLFSGNEEELIEYAREIKETVYRWTGIPVSVGIAPTKTLAKLANHIGKKSKKARGVVSLLTERYQDIALERVSVEDIWGVGRKNSMKLRSLGIRNALQFRDYRNERNIQKIFTKLGRMTQEELRGVPCFELEIVGEKKKEIMCSRSFGSPVVDFQGLRESIANYATSACEKMRAQQSACMAIEVFCHSDPYKVGETPYYAKDSFKLLTGTVDTRRVIKYAWSVLDKLFQMGIYYKKAGIKLSSLVDGNEMQVSLFGEADDERSVNLMKVMDLINAKEGPGTIRSMACGINDEAWKMKRDYLSPRFVSGWTELPKCK